MAKRGHGVKGNVIDVLNDLALSNNTVKILLMKSFS